MPLVLSLLHHAKALQRPVLPKLSSRLMSTFLPSDIPAPLAIVVNVEIKEDRLEDFLRVIGAYLYPMRSNSLFIAVSQRLTRKGLWRTRAEAVCGSTS